MARHIHKIPGSTYRKVEALPEDLPVVKGYNFNQGVNYRALLQSYLNTGLQATNLGVAIQLINTMVRLSASGCLAAICSLLSFKRPPPVTFSNRRSKSERSPSTPRRTIRSTATASRASSSISATRPISSAAASGRASDTWRSTRWCGSAPSHSDSPPQPTPTTCSLLRPGGCTGDHSWRHRGGSHQVSWSGFCRRLHHVRQRAV